MNSKSSKWGTCSGQPVSSIGGARPTADRNRGPAASESSLLCSSTSPGDGGGRTYFSTPLWHQPRGFAVGDPPPLEVPQQPGGKFPADQDPGTGNERFASPGQAQRFLFAFSHIREHFRPRRHLMSAPQWRTEMSDRFAVWDEIITAAAA
jgi:hypothetical protein